MNVGGTKYGIVIPSFNSGPMLARTVRDALPLGCPVIVVIDGSTDGSENDLRGLEADWPHLHVIKLSRNSGKGAAALTALEFASGLGLTHTLLLDSDGQHEAADIPEFLAASRAHPEAMILGVPVFGPDAPRVRVQGRRAGNWFANLETWWGGIEDSLFGLRVYPVPAALQILHSIRGARRFDFDTQLAVRLYWDGVPPLNIPTRVHYHEAAQGGVSHFRYWRDNLLLVRAHAALLSRSFLLVPRLARLRRRGPLARP